RSRVVRACPHGADVHHTRGHNTTQSPENFLHQFHGGLDLLDLGCGRAIVNNEAGVPIGSRRFDGKVAVRASSVVQVHVHDPQAAMQILHQVNGGVQIHREL